MAKLIMAKIKAKLNQVKLTMAKLSKTKLILVKINQTNLY
jgi:hypothetical protein